VRENKIDLIHTHLIFADIIGSVLGKLLKVPVVTTLHNEPNSYRKRRLDRRLLARISAERITTHLVTVANFIRDQFMIYWKIPDSEVSCIYNGVDLDEFLQIPDQIENDTNEAGLTIVNVASLTAQKAQHILLEAAKLVLSEQPETRFLIVGKGDLEESLKAKALALGISENVVFTGVRRDIPEILSQSHIFVLSSLWEGLPLSAIEAMAAARGVVVTDVGGIRELIEPNKHGLVVQPGDVKELANALLMLMRNQSLRISYAKSARENVRTLFNIKLTARQYQELYLTVLDST
jgi:glycosyltransferase involved in cell wall biosynthesis